MSFLPDDQVEQIAARVQHGVPLQTALKAAGVTDVMVKGWERIANGSATDDQELRGAIVRFSERIGRAQAECEVTMVENSTATSTMVGASGLPEWRAGAWLLKQRAAVQSTLPSGAPGPDSNNRDCPPRTHACRTCKRR